MGKPHTQEKAQEMLMRLSGKTHSVHTGFCIIDCKTGERRSGVETSRVTFRTLSSQEIAQYSVLEESLTGAGAYMMQEKGGKFIASIEGGYDTVVGLPLERILAELRAFGVHL
jgi:septum formation protein